MKFGNSNKKGPKKEVLFVLFFYSDYLFYLSLPQSLLLVFIPPVLGAAHASTRRQAIERGQQWHGAAHEEQRRGHHRRRAGESASAAHAWTRPTTRTWTRAAVHEPQRRGRRRRRPEQGKAEVGAFLLRVPSRGSTLLLFNIFFCSNVAYISVLACCKPAICT